MHKISVTLLLLTLTFTLSGCSEQETLPELPPLDRPLQGPPVLTDLSPLIMEATVQLEDNSGNVLTEVDNTAGSRIRLTFRYDGGAAPTDQEWNPERKTVSLKIVRKSKKSGRFVTNAMAIGKIQKTGENQYEAVAQIKQSVKPRDYFIQAKLVSSQKFAGGILATSSLKVVTKESE